MASPVDEGLASSHLPPDVPHGRISLPEGTNGHYWCHTCGVEVNVINSDGEMRCTQCDGYFVELIAARSDRQDLHNFLGTITPPPSSSAPSAATSTVSSPGRDPEDMRHRMEQNDGAIGSLALLRILEGSARSERASPEDEIISTISRLIAASHLRSLTAGAESTQIGDYAIGDITRLIERLGEGPSVSKPPSKACLDQLESFVIGSADHDAATTEQCWVCQDEYLTGDHCRRLPCAHVYHERCLMPWLETHHTCPVCRHELPTE